MMKSAAALSVFFSVGALMGQANQEIFDQRIRPVLQKNCASCHGSANASSGLSVASLDSLLAGGKHGAAIVPGDAKESVLIEYVRGQRTPRMPMGGALEANSIDALAKAIDALKATATTAEKSDPYLNWLLHKPMPPAVPAVRNQLGEKPD